MGTGVPPTTELADTRPIPIAHKRTQQTQPNIRTNTARFREHGLMPPTCDEDLRVFSERKSVGDAGPRVASDVGSHLTSNTAHRTLQSLRHSTHTDEPKDQATTLTLLLTFV
ncbi:hypothetical protein CORC01_01014 [Colletotrichum orchidophilum]|uniref:Uncharacterized protein n=1 Tax=Colletotrichum orchidophilum TaxID=1209926 RepID=A0A1G4BQT7_9PEZI|nr:uncharacterized protein CORC01_01014 [Colletotrichum orchidophilum]OHF03695.1 hypothetical protein CORC01_01014 [Colletotrichum orchidophilum]